MRRFNKRILASVALLTVLLGASLLLAPISSAQTAKSQGQALEIAPPVIYLTANPGQAIKTKIYIRNVSGGNLIVTGEANDFVAQGEDGTPKLLLNGSSNDPYSLRDWVAVPSSLLLVPREIKTMTITINVPSNASPGGHYGVIRFTGVPASLKSTGVSLSASIGSLVLMTVSGDIHESLSVKEFSANKDGKKSTIFPSIPINFVERIQNNGNVHEQPTGSIIVTNMFGKKVASVPVNNSLRSILPQSIRKFSQPLDKSVIGNKHLFGRYTASLSMSYGSPTKTLAATMTFWVIPFKLIAILIAVLIGGFFLFRYLIRRYNRAVVRRSNRRR